MGVPALASELARAAVLHSQQRVGVVEVPARGLTRVVVVAGAVGAEGGHARHGGGIEVLETLGPRRRVARGQHADVVDAQVAGVRGHARVLEEGEALRRRPHVVEVGDATEATAGGGRALVVVAVAQPLQVGLDAGVVEVAPADDLAPHSRGRLRQRVLPPDVVAVPSLRRAERVDGAVGGVGVTRQQDRRVERGQPCGVAVVGEDRLGGREPGHDELGGGGVHAPAVVVAPVAVGTLGGGRAVEDGVDRVERAGLVRAPGAQIDRQRHQVGAVAIGVEADVGVAADDVGDDVVQARLVGGAGVRVALGRGVRVVALALLEQRQRRKPCGVPGAAGVVEGALTVEPREAAVDRGAYVLAEVGGLREGGCCPAHEADTNDNS